MLEQIARIPRLGSLNLACGGAELVVLHTFDSVTSTATVDGRNPAPLDIVVYPIIYEVSYIPVGARFQPSTVLSLHKIILR